MTGPIHVTSPDNPRVKAVLRLRRQRVRRQLQLLIAEGVRQISRALEAGLMLQELYWCPSMVDPNRCLPNKVLDPTGSKPSEARCFTVTPGLMARIAYRQNPEGILAVFEQPRWQLQDLVSDSRKPSPWARDLWLVAVGTQKPGNLGTMVRSAEAAGCNGVLVADGVVDAFNPNAIHASTGAVFGLPTATGSVQAVLSFIHQRGAQVIAAVPQAQKTYSDVDLTGPVALVVGPEDVGLESIWWSAEARGQLARNAASQTLAWPAGDPGPRGCQVSIPMWGQVADSLNASAATAVLLFEAVRQRSK